MVRNAGTISVEKFTLPLEGSARFGPGRANGNASLIVPAFLSSSGGSFSVIQSCDAAIESVLRTRVARRVVNSALATILLVFASQSLLVQILLSSSVP